MDFLVRMDTSAVYQLPDREQKGLVERRVRARTEVACWRHPAQGLAHAGTESERRYLVGA